MAERNASRPWTAEEDKLLQQGVERFGEQENWKTIAVSIPGRTNKACRKRWLHSLSPSVKKTAWTAEEDQKLLYLYDQQGPKWSVIARQIPGRTDDACSKRYREALDPSLKKDVWTPEEDHKLNQAHIQHGMKWGLIGQELQRSGLACRNRWRLIERKRAARAALVLEGSGLRTLSIVTQRPSHESVSLFPYSQLGNPFRESSPPSGSPVLTPSISPHPTSSPNVVLCGPIPHAFPEGQTATLHDHRLLDLQAHTPSHRPGTINLYNDAQHSLTDFILNQQDLEPLLSVIFGQPSPCGTANESVGLRDFAMTSATIQGATTVEPPHTDAREVSSIGFDRFQDLNSKAILPNDGTANHSDYFDSMTTARDTASIRESQADMIATDNTVNQLQNFDLETFSRDTMTSSDPLNFELGTVLADIVDVRASDFRSHDATDKFFDLDLETLPLSSDFPSEHSRYFPFEALPANGSITNHSRDVDLAPCSPRQSSDLPDPLLVDSLLSGPTQSGCTRSDPMQFLQSDSLPIGPLSPDPVQSNPLRTHSLRFDLWKSSNFTNIVPLLPREASYSGLNFSSSHDDLSSTQSTPFTTSSSMSPISSPDSMSPALPNEQLPTGPTLHIQDSLSSVPRRRKPRKTKGPDAASRLSSNLPLSSDPKVRPYACGREGCWSIGASMSKSCFATSKQLCEHSKGDHEGEPLGDKPFRCGLSGCGKSWKSINGLQYHLQLSAAHFRNALSSQFSAQDTRGDLQTDSVDLFPDNSHRTYACLMPNCFKAYRQHSGLRYHLLHGHPEHMPVQLPLVPPALARQLPAKARKMRRKQSS